MDIFIARQPIFDSNRNIFAYELLFRNGLENAFPDIDGDTATSSVLSNTFFSFELKEILGEKPGFINFTKNLILNKTPLLFPQKNIIVEVLENIEPEKSIVDALTEVNEKGFTIALDDFAYHDKFKPLIDMCQIIKFDLIATPLESIADIVNDIQMNRNITLLAEKVETYVEFEHAKEMGFKLFQGYFFSKPEILSKRDIPANIIAKLKLINEFEKSDINLVAIEELIKNDVSTSYKLLKFINSAYFKRPNPINTIKDAITFIGIEELRKFINIVVVSDLCEGKPNELIRQSVICARICEQCGAYIKTGFLKEELFTLGLFSFLDAILDREMDDILEQIFLSDQMKNALKKEDKAFNDIMEIYHIFSNGDWENQFFKTIKGSKIEKQLPYFYLDSIRMANSFFDN